VRERERENKEGVNKEILKELENRKNKEQCNKIAGENTSLRKRTS
jgi:ribosomal protein S17E